MMRRIYVAGKLRASAVDYIKNVHKMITGANELRKLGFSVYVPCLDFLMGVVCGDYDYHTYFYNSQPWLRAADAIFVLPGHERSRGVKREVRSAKRWDIPVFYDIEKLKKWRDGE